VRHEKPETRNQKSTLDPLRHSESLSRSLPGRFQRKHPEESPGKSIDRSAMPEDPGLGRDKHQVTDEPPYGGGPGMVMKPEPIFSAVESLRTAKSRVILMAPTGRRFSQQVAKELAAEEHLIFVCGHYEGIDHRVAEHLADDEICIGDYVLTNGAIAAAIVVDAVSRLIPGVLGHTGSAQEESFAAGLLEYPQYTRPCDFRGWKVPEILLSGNHRAIQEWRNEQARLKTRDRRPDLLDSAS